MTLTAVLRRKGLFTSIFCIHTQSITEKTREFIIYAVGGRTDIVLAGPESSAHSLKSNVLARRSVHLHKYSLNDLQPSIIT